MKVMRSEILYVICESCSHYSNQKSASNPTTDFFKLKWVLECVTVQEFLDSFPSIGDHSYLVANITFQTKIIIMATLNV